MKVYIEDMPKNTLTTDKILVLSYAKALKAGEYAERLVKLMAVGAVGYKSG